MVEMLASHEQPIDAAIDAAGQLVQDGELELRSPGYELAVTEGTWTIKNAERALRIIAHRIVNEATTVEGDE